jgi:hypothetical protein
MKNPISLTFTTLLLAVSSLSAATHYVSLGSTNPTPPYTNWVTAATSIQAAVNVAAINDAVLVANGVYAGGVSVTKALALLSVNGPQFTIITGGFSDQCVYLADGASLTGFTLTNGFLDYGYGGGVECASTNAFLTNCLIVANSDNGNGCGGGASGGTLYNCTLSGNSAWEGGGAYSSTLYNCTLSGNSAEYGGSGGASRCTLYNCTLNGNSGGGANSCTVYNCTLSGNSGGGANSCTVYNSTLRGNSASMGGGAYTSTLYNCTVSGNSAPSGSGGGAYSSTLYNCITYYNTAAEGANYDSSSTLYYCCTTPLPTTGVGNLALDPQLASVTHLSAASPCRGAGSAAYASGTDIDGEPWGNPPSIGCDEYHVGAVTGPLTVGLVASDTNVPVGYAVSLTALIEGRTTQSVWDFGDGVVVSNQPYASHAWAAPGDYAVALRAYNEANVTGVSATLAIHVVAQSLLYVAANSANPRPPYASWATAATNIQDAVNAAALAGAAVLVTNGVYPGGVSVTKPLTLLSVNGPQFTIINGGGWSQCVSLTNGASLTGFTLTNGHIYSWDSGGGVACASTNAFLTNCLIVGNSAPWGGGAYGGTLYNCTLSGNSASWGGGGASGATLYNCTLSGNSGSGNTGGASGATLYNCTLSGNSGGAFNSGLYNCTLSGNSGGGANSCTVYNCTLSGNSGGGANSCTVYNCTLSGNSASFNGGGATSCTLYNCTVSGNSGTQGGGACFCTLYNCIAYYNTAAVGANYDSSSTLNYCCTTPLPTNGVGNLALDPQLASTSHLSAGSPCRGAGSAAYATGTDIDGEPWGNPPSIGCDEYHVGAVTGPLTVGLVASYTNVAVGFVVSLTALIEGRTTQSVWDFGDGVVVSNRPYASHAWAAGGDYAVVLRAYNESLPTAVSATGTVHVVGQPVYYVASASPDPQPPYTSWSTAARTIQDAVDAALPGALMLVNNGTYPGGVSVTKPLTLRSVNGPQFTVINGGGTNRCVSLTDGASLTGFTLTNGHQYDYGGGVACASTNAFLTNCLIVGNSASFANSLGGGACGCTLYNCTLSGNSSFFGDGGGASDCTLYNCTLSGNSARDGGGGACWSTLYNCTLSGNSATHGGAGGGASSCTLYNCTLTGNSATPCGMCGSGSVGGGAAGCTLYNCTLSGNSAGYGGSGDGAFGSTLYNCIVYFNTSYLDTSSGATNFDSSSILNYCCTTPLPTNGVGNITNAPLFVDSANGNLRLQSHSPCINAGNNTYVTTTTDLDGRPRIVGGTVDMGAYECQSPALLDFYNWLQTYGLSTSALSVYADSDGDGMNNWQEWVCGTNPTNRLSVLRLLSPSITGTKLTVTWQSVAGVNYFLVRSTNPAAPFTLLATNILGQAGMTSYGDTNAAGKGPFFYRVGIRSP